MAHHLENKVFSDEEYEDTTSAIHRMEGHLGGEHSFHDDATSSYLAGTYSTFMLIHSVV